MRPASDRRGPQGRSARGWPLTRVPLTPPRPAVDPRPHRGQSVSQADGRTSEYYTGLQGWRGPSIQFNSNDFIIPQEILIVIIMWCVTLKTENTNTLQDTETESERQISQSIQGAEVTKSYYKKPS